MPGPLCGPARAGALSVATGAKRATVVPLRLISSAFEGWRARRIEERLQLEERARLARETCEQLEAFHDALWNNWPQHVSQLKNRRDEEERDDRS